MGDKALNIIGLIVVVAIITAVVKSKNSSSVINSMGSAFSGSISAALGNSVTGSGK